MSSRLLSTLAIVGWVVFVLMTWVSLTRGPASGDVFQVDWHVYVAGARDLIEGDLYRVPLDAGGLPLSSPEFNLPPMSAVWAVPLLGLPVLAGGIAWQVLAAASVALAAIAAVDLARIARPALWAGLVLGPLSLTLLYLEGLHLATNNYLVLGLVAVGSWAYLTSRDTAAGVLIGLAIATKLWPVTLLVLAVRERRWKVVGWAAMIVVVQGAVLFGWLGFDAIGEFAANLRLPIPATGHLIGPTAVPWLRDLWNSGLGWVVALVLLVLPVHGKAGAGTAILAGMAPIANLWIHYAPTVLFAGSLLLPFGRTDDRSDHS